MQAASYPRARIAHDPAAAHTTDEGGYLIARPADQTWRPTGNTPVGTPANIGGDPGGSRAAEPGPAMLINLHLLRFVAALLVLAYHVAEQVRAAGLPRAGWPDGIALTAFGGVDVFFVISGFIMWHTTRAERGAGAAWRFARRRAARIYSGYWPFLLLSLWLWATYHPRLLDTRAWLESLFLIPNPAGGTVQLVPDRLFIPVSWTLIYELYFYMAFALIILLPPGKRLKMLLASLLLVVVGTLYAVRTGVYAPDRMVETSLLFTLYLSPFCAEFLAGCLIGEYCTRRTVPRPFAWLAFGAAVMVFTGWANARWFSGELIVGYHNAERVLLLSGGAAGFVLGAVGLDQRQKHLFPRLCLILGGSSYALYLSHTLWLQLLFDTGVRGWLARHDLIGLGYWAAALAIVLFSATFYQVAERPLHRLFRNILGVGKRTEL